MKIQTIKSENNMKKFICLSGGVESSTMCVLFGANSNAIFADTGFEHEATYNRLTDLVQKVKDIHKNDFTLHKVKNEKYESLPAYIKESKFYPNFQSRFCTRMFKIEPIDQFLKQFENEGVEIMIGLNRDEAEDRTGNHGLLPFVTYSYPLVENNISRDMCKAILLKADLLPNFPPYMQRGGCIGCYYKRRSEFKAMLHLNPKEYDLVLSLEEAIQDERKEFFAPTNIREGLRKFKEATLNSPTFFEPSEGYEVTGTGTSCGVFCNR